MALDDWHVQNNSRQQQQKKHNELLHCSFSPVTKTKYDDMLEVFFCLCVTSPAATVDAALTSYDSNL